MLMMTPRNLIIFHLSAVLALLTMGCSNSASDSTTPTHHPRTRDEFRQAFLAAVVNKDLENAMALVNHERVVPLRLQGTRDWFDEIFSWKNVEVEFLDITTSYDPLEYGGQTLALNLEPLFEINVTGDPPGEHEYAQTSHPVGSKDGELFITLYAPIDP